MLRKLLFTVEMQHLQHWPITDGKEICSFKRFVIDTCPGRRHEDIARTPFEAYPIDHRVAVALEDHINGTTSLAPGGCARAGIEAVHLAGKGTHCRASRERVHILQADHWSTMGLM